MYIEFTCPYAGCHRKLRASDKVAGKVVKCPGCGNAIRIPVLHAPDGKQVTPPAGQPGPPVARLGKVEPRGQQDPLIGAKLGHLKIMEKVGQGGMGAVYKAWNVQLNRVVAVKLLPDSVKAKDPSLITRFLDEARLAAQLEHPNVVTVHAVGEEAGHQFIEMRFVEGQTLRDMIEQGPVEPRFATQVIMEAAKGLSAAHECGIIHRDVKPHNIMVDKRGQVMVSDFGLARFEESFTEMTSEGKVMGTPYYMSPEQCKGERLDARSDIYSLGATYFHAVTGQPPFDAETLVTIMYKHFHEPVRNPSLLNPGVSFEMSAVIQKTMAKDPKERYQSCAELIEDLQSALVPRAPVAKPKKVKKSRAGLYVALATIAVLIAVVVAGFVVMQLRKQPSAPPTQATVAVPPRPAALPSAVAVQPAPPPSAGALQSQVANPESKIESQAPARPKKTGMYGPGPAVVPPEAEEAPLPPGERKATTSAASGEFPAEVHREAVALFLSQQRRAIENPKTLFVRQDGKAEFKTLSDALASANTGDIIEIADSATYTKELKIEKGKDNLWLRAAKGQKPVMNAEDQREHCLTIGPGVSGLIVDGLAFTGAKKVAIRAVKSPELVIANCTFEKNRASVEMRESPSGHLLANTFSANNGPCAATFGVKYVVAADNCFLEMPMVPGLDRRGIRMESAAEAYVVNTLFARTTNPLQISNSHCAVVHNLCLQTGFVAGLDFSNEGNILRDNIIFRCGDVQGFSPTAPLTGQTIDFNDYYACNHIARVSRPDTPTVWYKTLFEWQNALGYDTNSISAPPMFFDPKKSDFRLLVGSPCAGKASDGRDMGLVFDMSGLELPLWDGKPLVRRPTKQEISEAKARAEAQALLAELKPINAMIDEYRYDDALGQARTLEKQYGNLLARKIANVVLLKSVRKAAIDAINSGKNPLPMKEMSRRYAFTGDIVKADERFIYAQEGKFKKEWPKFEKSEVANLYRALGDRLNDGLSAIPKGDAASKLHIALSVLAVEGNVDEKTVEAAKTELTKAQMKEASAKDGSASGGDCAPYADYLEKLKNLMLTAREPAAAPAGSAAAGTGKPAFGPIREWSLIGPFPCPNQQSWSEPQFPEKEVALDKEYEIGGKKLRWRSHKSDDENGFVNLKPMFRPNDKVAAYAYAEITVDKDTDCFFRLGSDDGILCWLNGQCIFKFLGNRPCVPDQDLIPVHLAQGKNRVLLKMCNGDGYWAFAFRVAADKSDLRVPKAATPR